MDKDKETDWKLLVIVLLLVVPTIMLRGYVLTQLWAWFVVPFGAPQIALWHACGVSTFAALLFANPSYDAILHSLDERSNNVKLRQAIAWGLLVPLFAWGTGAIFHALM